MPAPRLPKNANAILDQAHINVPDSYEDKWLIYNNAPSCSSDDTWQCFRTAVQNNGSFEPEEDELEELGWCWPANTGGRELRTIQEVLNFHFDIVSKRISDEPTEQKHFVYEFGVVVITSSRWQEKGLTATIEGSPRPRPWQMESHAVLHIHARPWRKPDERMGHDASFDDVREQFQNSDENQRISDEDEHADNHGGTVPHGAWQFSMYSTMAPMNNVKTSIPDPRGDLSFGAGEECFAAVEGQMSYEEVLERFPLSYSKFVQAQLKLESSARTAVRRHAELFVIADSSNPAADGVTIARLSWDREVDRSESELRRVGRESVVQTRRCDVGILVETLEYMTDGGDEQ